MKELYGEIDERMDSSRRKLPMGDVVTCEDLLSEGNIA